MTFILGNMQTFLPALSEIEGRFVRIVLLGEVLPQSHRGELESFFGGGVCVPSLLAPDCEGKISKSVCIEIFPETLGLLAFSEEENEA